MANSFRNDIYRPTKTLSYITVAMLGGIGLCAFFFMILTLVMAFAPDARVNVGEESIEVGLGFIGLISLLEIPLGLAAAIFFLIWEYRAYNNLPALGARNLQFSPGWAVGWWFIPFANLVKPFQVMRELYNESQTVYDEDTVYFQTSQGTPAIIGFWWAAYLVANITFRISDKLIDDRTGVVSTYFPVFFFFASVVYLVAALLAINIVKQVTERQEERFNQIATRRQFAPPAPPTFEQNQ